MDNNESKSTSTPDRVPVGSSALFASMRERVRSMTRPEVQAAIDACHPCFVETPESYDADILAMELIHQRHDKRVIVNMIRWVLMGCPEANAIGEAQPPAKNL